MSTLHHFASGGYEFLEGGFPYSQGVIASQGFQLVRVRLARAPGINAGFERIAAHLQSVGRPLTALCAVELRSPRPFTFSGFHDFNVGYVNVLSQWGLIQNGLNPVGRSNVCPVYDAPSEPVFHAFSYTVPTTVMSTAKSSELNGRDFVVAGSGEWPEGQPFPQAIVARGDCSAEGLAAKVAFVLQTMKGRCAGLGGDWGRLTAAQIYTAENFHGLLKSHFASAQLTGIGLSWNVCKPPIIELEFEMDVRSLACERVLLD
jgi:hypothetical protein